MPFFSESPHLGPEVLCGWAVPCVIGCRAASLERPPSRCQGTSPHIDRRHQTSPGVPWEAPSTLSECQPQGPEWNKSTETVLLSSAQLRVPPVPAPTPPATLTSPSPLTLLEGLWKLANPCPPFWCPLLGWAPGKDPLPTCPQEQGSLARREDRISKWQVSPGPFRGLPGGRLMRGEALAWASGGARPRRRGWCRSSRCQAAALVGGLGSEPWITLVIAGEGEADLNRT